MSQPSVDFNKRFKSRDQIPQIIHQQLSRNKKPINQHMDNSFIQQKIADYKRKICRSQLNLTKSSKNNPNFDPYFHNDNNSNKSLHNYNIKPNTPTIIQSYVISKQKNNHNNHNNNKINRNHKQLDQSSLYEKENSYSNKKNNQKYIMQKDQYNLDSNRSSRLERQKSKVLNNMCKDIGIKNQKNPQIIVMKRKNSQNSIRRGAKTQPTQPQNYLHTIKQIKQKSTKNKSFFNNNNKINSSVNLHLKNKLVNYNYNNINDFRANYLPKLQSTRSPRLQFTRPPKLINANGSKSNFTLKKFKSQPKRSQSSLKIQQKQIHNQITHFIQSKKSKPILSHPIKKQQKLRTQITNLLSSFKQQKFRYRPLHKPLLNQNKKKASLLKIKQQMLGKIVLDRVQNHIIQDSQSMKNKNYIVRVNSEKSIDQAMIEFIKMKVNRAECVLK